MTKQRVKKGITYMAVLIVFYSLFVYALAHIK